MCHHPVDIWWSRRVRGSESVRERVSGGIEGVSGGEIGSESVRQGVRGGERVERKRE